MLPVVTPEEMTEIDRNAPEGTAVLVARAAGAVSRMAVAMLGGTYGRRIVVVAGPGNNGEDGRVAASMLARRGAKVIVVDALDAPDRLPSADLVIDAAFGTGFRGEYVAPDTDGAPVLAVDIPSGVSGLTGAASGAPVRAERTVSFAALKPGLLLGDGPAHTGVVHVADIGLDVGGASMHLVTDADVVSWVPGREPDAHKWRHAVWVIAGSPGMSGAAWLCASAALRGGAGYVRLSTPGERHPEAPTEAVVVALEDDWSSQLASDGARFTSMVLGPGLGRSEEVRVQVRSTLEHAAVPVVLDGDGLHALGAGGVERLATRRAATVLTPHDGEFSVLTGAAPGGDRISSVRALAERSGSVVLLKGPTTVVAGPEGDALLVRSGDQRLATAGTGDVLSGLVAAHLALGVEPLRAAASAAHVHGAAAMDGKARGLVASDLLDLVSDYWAGLGGWSGLHA